jgi:hypothetical protein
MEIAAGVSYSRRSDTQLKYQQPAFGCSGGTGRRSATEQNSINSSSNTYIQKKKKKSRKSGLRFPETVASSKLSATVTVRLIIKRKLSPLNSLNL